PAGGAERPRVARRAGRGVAAPAGGLPLALDPVLPGGAYPRGGGAFAGLHARLRPRPGGARPAAPARPPGPAWTDSPRGAAVGRAGAEPGRRRPGGPDPCHRSGRAAV